MRVSCYQTVNPHLPVCMFLYATHLILQVNITSKYEYCFDQ